MLIHKKYISENLNTPDEVRCFAYFLKLKQRFKSSIIYNFYSTGYASRVATIIGVDRHTVVKYLKMMQANDLTFRRGNHLLLKSIEKEYEYRLLPNGKVSKNSDKGYIEVKVKGDWTVGDIVQFIRGLKVKIATLGSVFAKINDMPVDATCEKDKANLINRCKKFKALSFKPREMLGIKIGIAKMAKEIAMSKSTAHRMTEVLSKNNVIGKFKGKLKTRGFVNMIKPGSKIPYGWFIDKNLVLSKECNSYCF